MFFIFTPIFGGMIQFDEHIFKWVAKNHVWVLQALRESKVIFEIPCGNAQPRVFFVWMCSGRSLSGKLLGWGPIALRDTLFRKEWPHNLYRDFFQKRNPLVENFPSLATAGVIACKRKDSYHPCWRTWGSPAVVKKKSGSNCLILQRTIST